MSDHESLGDEGIRDGDGRGHNPCSRAVEQPKHAEPRDEGNAEQHELLDDHPGDQRLDDRHNRVLGHGARKAGTHADRSRKQVLPRSEDEVVAECEARHECGTRHQRSQEAHP